MENDPTEEILEDSTEEALTGLTEEISEEEDQNQQQCIKQYVTNAEKNAKSLSNQQKANLSSATNASRKGADPENLDNTKKNSLK